MMQNLMIVGAGGFAREVCGYALSHPDCGVRWAVKGFLDDNPAALKGFDYPVGIVGSIRDYQPQPGDLFVNGLGLPKVKLACLPPLLERGAEFLTFIHPRSLLGPNVTLGRGCVLCPDVILTADVTVGDFVVLNCRCCAGHDSRIGSWSTLSAFCDVTGYAEVGERVFMGSHACVIPGKRIGDGALLGAGSVAIRNLPGEKTSFGVPAKPI